MNRTDTVVLVLSVSFLSCFAANSKKEISDFNDEPGLVKNRDSIDDLKAMDTVLYKPFKSKEDSIDTLLEKEITSLPKKDNPVKETEDIVVMENDQVVPEIELEDTIEISPLQEVDSLQGEVESNDPGKLKDTIEQAMEDEIALENIWDDHLKQFVSSSGKVNYKGWTSKKAELEEYLSFVSSNPPQKSWSASKSLAYWINTYNAFTVLLILDHYPIKSIRDLEGGNPWDRKWIEIGDRTLSLNDIEHQIIRPEFNDARIHFAVNCAARSCPPLLNKAYSESNVDALLTQQTRKFISNSTYNKISPETLQLSRIFEWYADDFGDIITYINKYNELKVQPNAQLGYIDYDWTLNE